METPHEACSAEGRLHNCLNCDSNRFAALSSRCHAGVVALSTVDARLNAIIDARGGPTTPIAIHQTGEGVIHPAPRSVGTMKTGQTIAPSDYPQSAGGTRQRAAIIISQPNRAIPGTGSDPVKRSGNGSSMGGARRSHPSHRNILAAAATPGSNSTRGFQPRGAASRWREQKRAVGGVD